MSGPGSTAAAWAASRRVGVGGRGVRFREAGMGPPLVLVHGLGVSADYWFRNGPALAGVGFRVLAPDLPGFGRTPGPGCLSVPAQAEALARWAEAVGVGSAVYVGHSLGAQAVLQLAADRPDAADGLVLASPTGAPGPAPLLRQLWGLIRDIPREPAALVPPVAQAYLRAGLPRVWRSWRAGTRHYPLPLLPRVRCPALVVVGVLDPVVPAPFADALARGLPHGRTEWIDGAAHAVHFGRPEAFNRAVARFAEGAPRYDPTAPQEPTQGGGPSTRDAR